MVMPLGNEEKPQITPWATYLLIALNLLCFGLEQVRPESFLIAFAATPYEITHEVDIADQFRYHVEPTTFDPGVDPESDQQIMIHQARGPSPIWLTLFSAMFLHANLIHLAGNMLFLFIFGLKIEEAFGHVLYLGFYLACGLVGTLAQISVAPESLTPIVGASGAIAGIMGAYLIRFPRDRVRVLFLNFLVLIPAYGVIGVWITIQLFRSHFLSGAIAQAGNVAYLSHLGGAALGMFGGVILCFKNASDSSSQTDR